jgi:hypothetical protein
MNYQKIPVGKRSGNQRKLKILAVSTGEVIPLVLDYFGGAE